MSKSRQIPPVTSAVLFALLLTTPPLASAQSAPPRVHISSTSIPPASSIDPALYRELRWRMIGPHRGGRTKAATGVPGQPNVFYACATNGGCWKTTDYGHVWFPIFDEQPTGSVGSIAVAPSAPDIVYVGSGEGLQCPGV